MWRAAASVAIGAAASLLIPSWLWWDSQRMLEPEEDTYRIAEPAPPWMAGKFANPGDLEGVTARLRGMEATVYMAPGAQPDWEESGLIVRIGWPFRAARAWAFTRHPPATLGLHPPDPEHGTVRPGWPEGFVLFYTPLWPGFALNTAFHGVLALLLWSAPGFAIRRLRARRGRCPNCGYDLRGLSTAQCPECGASRIA